MIGRLAALTARLLPDREVELEARLYHLLTLVAAFLALGVVTPVNLVQKLSPWLHLAVIVFGLANVALYLLARRGRRYPGAFYALLMLVLDASFFTNGGSVSSIPMYLFLAAGLPVIFFTGRTRWLLLGFYLLDGCALFLADHYAPQLNTPFTSEVDRLIDLTTGFAISSLACVLVFWAVVGSYHEERKALQDANAELLRNLKEIRTLRGLLPLCAWCRKVRNDEGHWLMVERYLATHTGASITHALCPDCAKNRFPEPPPAPAADDE